MAKGDLVPVEIAYALPDEQVILKLDVPPGTSLRAAIEQSGILRRFPQIDLQRDRIGVYSRIASLEETAAPGDRIEIYRPLLADPKEVRRQRAKARGSDQGT